MKTLFEAAKAVVAAWDDEVDPFDFKKAMDELRAAIGKAPPEDVPEVEVSTALQTTTPQTPVSPVRRSGAKNVSSPHLQSAFINEARASMGQPTVAEVRAMLNYEITMIFNVDLPPRSGFLTDVIEHPSSGPAYLVLDHEDTVLYPLNSIQTIERVR
jgi:phospholipase C